MSRIISLAVVVLLAVSLNDRTTQAAPSTQPSLEQQNAQLKELVKDYSDQLDRANAKLKFEEQRTVTLKSQMETLVLQFKLLQRTEDASRSISSASAPNSNSVMGSFEYNGKTVYLVGPLVAKQMTLKAASPKADHPYRTEVQSLAPAK